jgi:hypothetical protein
VTIDRVFTLRHARVKHVCKQCHGLILPGQDCWTVTIGGGGLGSLKFPDYIHMLCRVPYEKAREEREARWRSQNTL